MKTLKKVLFILLLVIFIPLLIVNVTIMVKAIANPNEVPSVFGYKPMIVLTGSMENTIMTGDLIFSKNYDESIKLAEGDIISFRDTAQTIVTHRIAKVDNLNGEDVYITKGDNNNTTDEGYVYKDKIEGVYKFRIAKLGSVLNFIQTPVGIVIVILTILIIGLLIIIFGDNKSNEDKELLKEFEEFKKAKKESN